MNIVDLPEFLSRVGKPVFLAIRRFPSLDGSGHDGVTVNGSRAAVGFAHDRIEDRDCLQDALEDARAEDAAVHAVCLGVTDGTVVLEDMTGIPQTPNAPPLSFHEPVHAILGIWKDGEATLLADLETDPEKLSRVAQTVETIRANNHLNGGADIVALTGLTLRLAQPGRAEIAPLDLRAILEDEIAAEP